jgi:DNA-binding PadR family transcriptional regulator
MTDAELAILSLLSEGPSYDHDLNKLIDARGLRRWTAIGSSSMYYVLDKLEKQGLISKVAEHDGRRQFQISPAGTGVLQTSVADLLSTPRAYDRSFELGLANLMVLKSSQVHAALLSRQQDLSAQLARLRETLESEAVGDSFEATALFSHRAAMIEAELYWLARFIETWKEQAPTDPEIVIEPAIIPRSRQVILPQDPDSVHKQRTREIPPHRQATPPSSRTAPSIPKPSKKPPEET